MRYSHACCIAFTCNSDTPAESLTDAELIAALEARVADLRQTSGLISEGTVWVEETDETEGGDAG